MIQFCMEWRCAPKNRLKEINLNLPSVLRRSHSLISTDMSKYLWAFFNVFLIELATNRACMPFTLLHLRLIALLAFVTLVLTSKTLPICTIQNVKTEKWFCAKLFVISCNNNHFLSILICCHPHAMAADIFGIHLLIYLNIYHLKVSTVAWDFPECFLYSLKLIWIPD